MLKSKQRWMSFQDCTIILPLKSWQFFFHIPIATVEKLVLSSSIPYSEMTQMQGFFMQCLIFNMVLRLSIWFIWISRGKYSFSQNSVTIASEHFDKFKTWFHAPSSVRLVIKLIVPKPPFISP